MNEDTIKGKTKEFKGQLKVWWGKLTDNDLKVIEGNTEKLAGVLQERYGWTKDQVKKEINKRLSRSSKGSTYGDSASNLSASGTDEWETKIEESKKGYKGKTKMVRKDVTTENQEDPYEEQEYDEAQEDLTRRRRTFERPVTTENPQGWDEPNAIDRVDPLE